MKQDTQYIPGEGARLKELLAPQFKSQREAAQFLGCNQADINRYYKADRLSTYFWNNYAAKLRELGLNPGYISDPRNQAPYFEELAEVKIAKLREEIKRLLTMKQKAV